MTEEKRMKAADEIFCGTCGAAIKIAAEICPKCGVRQKDATQTKDVGIKALERTIPGISLLKSYYQFEFRKIFESEETYKGKWNWAAFFFGPLWAFSKGMWNSGLVMLVVCLAGASVTHGAGAVISGIFYGLKGNYLYYRLLKTNKQSLI